MLTEKKMNKIEKILGKEGMQELEALTKEALESAIVGAEASVKQASDELEANPVYQELKENLKALSAALKEVKARQRAKVQYGLHLLEEK